MSESFNRFDEAVSDREQLSYTWANEVCAGNNEERAIVISSMNGFQYAVAAWLPILIFPQTMAPTFRYGFTSTFGFVIVGLALIVLIQMLHSRDLKRAKGSPTIFDDEEMIDKSTDSEMPKSMQVSDVRAFH